LQTGNLQKNQIKKMAKAAERRFGRPFLGQNTGDSIEPVVPSALLEMRPQRNA
jgi:hypothetical protein